MSCNLDLPATGDAPALLQRLNSIIPDLGPQANPLLIDAATDFFDETRRWRYTKLLVELAAGNQEMHLELENAADVALLGVRDTIYLRQNTHDDCDEMPVPRKSDGTATGFGFSRGIDQYQEASMGYGAHEHYHHYHGFNQLHGTGVLQFYEPEPGLLLLSSALTCDAIFRIEILLAPKTMAGIDMVPAELIRQYRRGIVGGAVVRAMELSNKPWTKRTEDGYDPRALEQRHMYNWNKAVQKARAHHRKDGSRHRPYRDKFSVVGTDHYRNHYYDK